MRRTRARLVVRLGGVRLLALWLGGGIGAAQELLAPQEPPPGPEPSEDPAGAPVVGVWVEYQTQGRTVRDRVEHYVPIARECFDATYPLETRAAGRYEVCFWIDNPDRDPDAWGFIGGAGSCGSGGANPELEACLRDAIPPYSAPPDVVSIAVHVVVDTDARGLVGHGSEWR